MGKVQALSLAVPVHTSQHSEMEAGELEVRVGDNKKPYLKNKTKPNPNQTKAQVDSDCSLISRSAT